MSYTILSARYANDAETVAFIDTAEAGEVAISETDTPDDWADFLAWVTGGGVPDPYEAPPAPTPFTRLVDMWSRATGDVEAAAIEAAIEGDLGALDRNIVRSSAALLHTSDTFLALKDALTAALTEERANALLAASAAGAGLIGPAGPQGPSGAAGATGPAGPSGADGVFLGSSLVTMSTWSNLLTATIPSDDTIPQIGEGNQVLVGSYTPLSATSILRLTYRATCVTTAGTAIHALFVNGDEDAVRSCVQYHGAATENVSLVYEYAPGETTEQTFQVRAGATTAANIYFNGSSGGRLLGGTQAATLLIEEIEP